MANTSPVANRANIIAGTFAVIAAVVVMVVQVRFIHRPESLLDWGVMLFAGLVSGIFVFFVVWGHFQQPAPPKKR